VTPAIVIVRTILLFRLQVLVVRRTSTSVVVIRVNMVERVRIKWMDLPAIVHLGSQVDFLPTVPGLTVQLIIVINTGKQLPDMVYCRQKLYVFVWIMDAEYNNKKLSCQREATRCFMSVKFVRRRGWDSLIIIWMCYLLTCFFRSTFRFVCVFTRKD